MQGYREWKLTAQPCLPPHTPHPEFKPAHPARKSGRHGKVLARAARTGYSKQRIAKACAALAMVVWQ